MVNDVWLIRILVGIVVVVGIYGVRSLVIFLIENLDMVKSVI